MRRTIVQICRYLGQAGYGVALPDLAGMAEHPVRASDASVAQVHSHLAQLGDWASGPGRCINAVSFRAGCLFDDMFPARSAWRFVPENGDKLTRTMLRTEVPEESDDGCTFVLGQHVSRNFLTELAALTVTPRSPVRTLRLATDRDEADRHIHASPLWRHAEPGFDADLAQLLANDIIDWTTSCAAS